MKIKQLLTALCTFLMLMTAGCSENVQEAPNRNLSETEWSEGHGELPGQIGHVDIVQPQENWMFESPDSVLELGGYAPPSGLWFLYNGEGKLGYSISGGTMRAGDEISVSVSAPSDDVLVNRRARVRLTSWEASKDEPIQLDEHIVTISTVKQQETLYSSKLPDSENAAYLLTIEILDEQDKAEDTMGRAIYVPAPEVNASWHASQDSYSGQSHADVTLYNAGPTVLTLGTYYTLEKKVGTEWRVVPFPEETVFPDIGIVIAPGQNYEQAVLIGGLDSGLYRVVKTISADGIEGSIDLAAEFRVES
ncbi:immunoglobulin-like domain-containing protein [Paenibacillus senegalensis]|uniref:immunoglobulin-like domain-containing protein n=1 Tax=Paenibacillus senegalensis TaxID=1465766 RepID=UPI000289E851|nr:immunoglobulin-like domain-containing protein [Paenibacillus senegalensis]